MSTISLRLPDSLHKQVRELAERDSISINQFNATGLAAKMPALLTGEYLAERARGKPGEVHAGVTKSSPSSTS
jgi:hypothetical protein